MEQLRLAPVSLLAGLALGVGTVAVYQWTAGLVLAVAVALLTVVATPPGWGTRLPLAVGNAVAVGSLAVPRGEGDYLVSASVGGYVVLALALVVLVASLATLPRPGRAVRSGPAADTPSPDASDPGQE